MNLTWQQSKKTKSNFKDSLRVFASVCKIVDGAFLSPYEINDPKLKDEFIRQAELRHKILVDRYGVRDRSSLIQAILQELGMDEIISINLTEGKFEVEETLSELLFD